jgi:hypothetical protein
MLSLAALELFVHIDPDLAPADLLAISADIPDNLMVHELALSDLSPHLARDPGTGGASRAGTVVDRRRKGGDAVRAFCRRPDGTELGAHTAHAGFQRIQIGEVHDFSFDPRMWNEKEVGSLDDEGTRWLLAASSRTPKASRGPPGRREAGCVWVASRCRELQRSAELLREIIQSIEGFGLRERTLNLRVLGSIPSWLTNFP